MYQTVGHQGIELYAEAMGLPLYREVISGEAVNQGRDYKPTSNDEVEDLYRLLSRVKVSIFSDLRFIILMNLISSRYTVSYTFFLSCPLLQ